MLIHNFLECTLLPEVVHGGNGPSRQCTVFKSEEVEAPLQFINYTIVPPGRTFGLHRHENNNEFYVLLKGEGVYYQDGEARPVKAGDIMMNAPYGEHGLENTGSCDMELLIFEVNCV